MTPCSFAMSISSTLLVCVAWPSKISSTGLSFVAPLNCMNFFIQLMKSSVWIHPLGWHTAHAPGGAPSINSGFMRCRGNIIMGGMYCPAAEQQITEVTSCPLSAEVIEPICLFPLVATTLESDFGTVETPVSSQFQILSAVSSCSSTTPSSRSKNLVTATRLKPMARAAEVASGFRSDSLSECRFMKPLYQS